MSNSAARGRSSPLPVGFGIELDSWTRQLTPELMFGGSPVRIARLSPAGQAAWRDLRSGQVTSRATGLLARYLTDAGLAHPVPPALEPAPAVTVIIPVHDRADLLGRCLAALGGEHQVIVVDDASSDEDAVARVARRYGARLIRRAVNGGPGVARNTGLAEATTELIAFVDSDCEPAPDWIARLSGHFADPLVAVAAPRIAGRATGRAPGPIASLNLGLRPSKLTTTAPQHQQTHNDGPGSGQEAGRSTSTVTAAGRFAESNGALDLGGRPGRVMPRTAISYVPTAAMLVRRAALCSVAREGRVFDEAMRVGEDVDLAWRLHEAGWRVRYDPSVQVAHQEPGTWAGLLARRYRYGTSAAPLAQRHPGAIVHLALQPWPALTVAALLARRPVVAAAAFGGALATTGYQLRRAGVPRAGLTRATLAATRQTWLGLGRYSTQFAAPLLAAALAAPTRRRSTGSGRRVAVGSLLLGPPLVAWAQGARTLDPVRYTLARIADDVAYGLGVWSGCLAERTLEPLRPVIAWRPLRIDPPRPPAGPAEEEPRP